MSKSFDELINEYRDAVEANDAEKRASTCAALRARYGEAGANEPRQFPMQMVDGFPRRIRVDLYTPAEKAISDALQVVESVGAHPLLTDAVILLGKAQEKVADFVEMPK